MVEERLTQRQAPADRVLVIGLLARLANHFRADRPADSWQMLFEDYAADLAGISEPHMREVIDAARRESPWFPKVADLIERWQTIQRVEGERHRRARVLLELEPPKPWE